MVKAKSGENGAKQQWRANRKKKKKTGGVAEKRKKTSAASKIESSLKKPRHRPVSASVINQINVEEMKGEALRYLNNLEERKAEKSKAQRKLAAASMTGGGVAAGENGAGLKLQPKRKPAMKASVKVMYQ